MPSASEFFKDKPIRVPFYGGPWHGLAIVQDAPEINGTDWPGVVYVDMPNGDDLMANGVLTMKAERLHVYRLDIIGACEEDLTVRYTSENIRGS